MRFALALVFVAACTVPPPAPSVVVAPTGPTGAIGPKAEDFDPSEGPPHALLSVTIQDEGSSNLVSAFASPFAEPSAPGIESGSRCAQILQGCAITPISPKCGKTCSSDEFCGYDASCKLGCIERNADTSDCAQKTCAADEICRLDDKGKARCRIKEKFDAGKIRLVGKDETVSFTYPYETKTRTNDSFFPSGDITVKASGFQEDAGFLAFEHTFARSKRLDAYLDDLKSKEVISGSKALNVEWEKGEGSVQIFGYSDSAYFSCTAKDSDGSFALPREVIDEVLGGGRGLALMVARKTVSVKKGLTLGGELNGAELPTEGWLVVTQHSLAIAQFSADTATDACGNGVLDPSEACDTAIGSGPGKCPTSCNDNNACTNDKLVKDAADPCATQCTHGKVAIGIDDGCCPSGGNSNTDSDCSASCGNGSLDAGELCDTAIVSGPGKCVQSCDDGDSCTADEIESDGTCQARCISTAIETVTSGDGCCLEPGWIGPSYDDDCPMAQLYGACTVNSDCISGDCMDAATYNETPICTQSCDASSSSLRSTCPLSTLTNSTEFCLSDAQSNGSGKTNRCFATSAAFVDKGTLSNGTGLSATIAQDTHDFYFLHAPSVTETWKITVTPSLGMDILARWYNSAAIIKQISNLYPAGVAEEVTVTVQAGKRAYISVQAAPGGSYTLQAVKL